MTDIHAILEERGERYGSFKEHAQIAQEIKRALHRSCGWDKLKTHHTEALEMLAHKMARIVNGDPDYDDSWVDIVGYAQLIVNIIREDEGE